MKQKVLFIRTTEKCNAKCFMCNFAGSTKGHTLTIEEMKTLIKKIKGKNFRLIRFTGGEPLLNINLPEMISMLKKEGYLTSVITNGLLLPKKIDLLAKAGLDQIIVSIDGSDENLNDNLRGVKGIFKNSIEGIKKCKNNYPEIHVRVNTVVSNLNIDKLSLLNEMLVSLGVDEWAITPLKEDYNCYEDNVEYYINEYKKFLDYVDKNKIPRLLGFSKYWGGRTEEEINDLFYKNIHYKPNTICGLVDRVGFYIPSKELLLPCNSLGHRINEVDKFLDSKDDMFERANKMSKWLQKCGQKKCKGCSPINVFLAENPNIIDDDIWSF